MEPMVRLRRKEFMHQGRVNPETYYEGCVGGDVGVGCNPETTIQRILQSWLQHSRNFFFETSSKSSSNNSILMLKSQLNTYFYKSE